MIWRATSIRSTTGCCFEMCPAAYPGPDRLIDLLWRFLKAGHIDRGLFVAARAKVFRKAACCRRSCPISCSMSLMAWLEAKYLSKTRPARIAGHGTSASSRGVPLRFARTAQWKPAVAYCRYADDFVVIVKGTKAHAEAVREECRAFLEGKLKLTLNMEKTHITHVNDGFIFLGHRIIRKRGSSGRMAVVTTIPAHTGEGDHAVRRMETT